MTPTRPHPAPDTGFNIASRVCRTARAAAVRAGVELVEVTGMEDLREIAALFAEVWGRTSEGVPMPSESMRSLAHAGGLVNAAYDLGTGRLLGAAVLGRDVPGACYSYLAAAVPGEADRGIGRALKQHQRSWALDRDIDLITWTYDPLVARNGRFNLSRLGATVTEYAPAFYGRMCDELNGTDIGDRLVVRWQLRSSRALAAGEGVLPEPELDPVGGASGGAHVENGPDGLPALLRAAGECWVRVPDDVVALRHSKPALAQAWRSATSTWLQDAFASGLVADAVSRTGWYHLSGAA